ncbi:hypothetical protein OIV83_005599 [Microbotryomycetes sp. JL201]|nr:hypothetical protein OIV83_005599 [Microbotryomycetes sp. JL201]
MSLSPASNHSTHHQTLEQIRLGAHAELWSVLWFSHRVDTSWNIQANDDQQRAHWFLYQNSKDKLVNEARHRAYDRFDTEEEKAKILASQLGGVLDEKAVHDKVANFINYWHTPIISQQLHDAIAATSEFIELEWTSQMKTSRLLIAAAFEFVFRGQGRIGIV